MYFGMQWKLHVSECMNVVSIVTVWYIYLKYTNTYLGVHLISPFG